jgi:hypothetical protein
MPLVEIGGNVEQYRVTGFASTMTNYHFGSTNTPDINTISNLGTIQANPFMFTATQRVKVNASCVGQCSAASVMLSLQAGNATIVGDESLNPIASATDPYRIATFEGSHAATAFPVSGSFILEPGEVFTFGGDRDGFAVATDKIRGIIDFTVEKDFSNTNMAHIIKPAVCILKNILAYNTNPGATVTGDWQTLSLNTLQGESWFVTLSSNQFTLEPGSYEVDGLQSFIKSYRTQVVIYDVTNSSFVALGVCQYFHAPYICGGPATLTGSFTITASTVFAFKYRCTGADSAGLGENMGADSAVQSCYAELKIRKLK